MMRSSARNLSTSGAKRTSDGTTTVSPPKQNGSLTFSQEPFLHSSLPYLAVGLLKLDSEFFGQDQLGFAQFVARAADVAVRL